MPDNETTQPKRRGEHLAPYRFQPGNSGRPVGSRNKLTEHFVADVYADWKEHGVQALKDVREKSPTDYLKVVAGVITKDVAVTVRDYDDLSDAELAEQFARASARLIGGPALGGGNGEARVEAPLPH